MKDMKKSTLFGSIFVGVLIAFGFMCTFISLFTADQVHFKVCNMVVYVLLAVYLLYDFKRPHGNLLKYIMIDYCVLLAIASVYYAHLNKTFCIVGTLICALLMAYVAGRLNKINQNKFILVAVLQILIIVSVITMTLNILTKANGSLNFATTVCGANCLIIDIIINCCYFLRYEDHKKAGIMLDQKED